MADLTCLYKHQPVRDKIVQAAIDGLEKVLRKTNEFYEYNFLELLDYSGGSQPPKSEFIYEEKEGYIRFLQIRDFSNDDAITFIPESSKNKLCEAHDILLGRYGASVGKILTGKKGAYNVACAKLTILDESKLDRNFLFYLLHSSKIQSHLTGSSRSAQGGFNKNDLKKILLNIPPLSIQQKIVPFLEELDLYLLKKTDKFTSYSGDKVSIQTWLGSIQKLMKSALILEENESLFNISRHEIDLLRSAILQDAIQGKVIEQDENDEPASVLLDKIEKEKEQLIKEKKIKKQIPFPQIKEEEMPYYLPVGWEWVKLGNITQINPRNKTDDDTEVSFVPMKLIMDAFNNKHSFEITKWGDVKSGFTHFAENDVVIAKITPCFQNRKSAVMKNLKNGIGAGTTELYVVRGYGQLVIPEYLLCIFKTETFISSGVKTYTGTAGQQRVKKDYIENLAIPLPPLNEQKRIVEKVNELMALCDTLEVNIELSKQDSEILMKAVLQEAFTLKEEVLN